MTARRSRRELCNYGASTQPFGKCLGPQDQDGSCDWVHPANRHCRQAAKDHAFANPGHRVKVSVETFSLYLLPPATPPPAPRPPQQQDGWQAPWWPEREV